MSALLQFAAIVLSCLGIVLLTWWGLPGDPPQTHSASDELLLIANGHPFRRVPVRNLHRLHGRHRA